jgi:hypothetical protein
MIRRLVKLHLIVVPGIATACFCCSPKSEKKTDDSPGSVLDSLAQLDPKPIKQMPDTLAVSATHPLLITNRANSDSVQIFPYSLLFQEKEYDAFIVSFNDSNPTLITLARDQSVIDSVGLIGTLRKETAGYRIVKNVKISSPSEIVVTDTISRWSTDGNKKRITGSRKTEVWVRHLKIGNDGMIAGKTIELPAK